jgi:uncharacterized protein (TIGR00730 family)
MADTTQTAGPDSHDRLRAIRDSPTYRLAEDDTAFMESDAARAGRLALEFMRADLYLSEQQIRSTVVVFGSSRILSPEIARQRLDRLEGEQPGDDDVAEHERRVARARTAVAYSRYYDEARELGRCLAQRSGPAGHEFVIVTGGGPGIMEGANRGAIEGGGPSVGFNIRLPTEQDPNPYVTPTLAFRFHYFALRKMHFLLRARALVAFPGGYGTLDELFESLNLVQLRTIRPIPIVLVGREHWQRVVDFGYLVDEGLIAESDRALFTVVDSGAEAARHILEFHGADR